MFFFIAHLGGWHYHIGWKGPCTLWHPEISPLQHLPSKNPMKPKSRGCTTIGAFMHFFGRKSMEQSVQRCFLEIPRKYSRMQPCSEEGCEMNVKNPYSHTSTIKRLENSSVQGPIFKGWCLPSLKLTARTWKWMVGILVSFEMAYVQGRLLLVSRSVNPAPHKRWDIQDKQTHVLNSTRHWGNEMDVPDGLPRPLKSWQLLVCCMF